MLDNEGHVILTLRWPLHRTSPLGWEMIPPLLKSRRVAPLFPFTVRPAAAQDISQEFQRVICGGRGGRRGEFCKWLVNGDQHHGQHRYQSTRSDIQRKIQSAFVWHTLEEMNTNVSKLLCQFWYLLWTELNRSSVFRTYPKQQRPLIRGL